MRNILIAALFALCLGSCDALVTYQLQLQNGTTQDLYVTYTRTSSDTTITLAPGATALVLETQEINSGVKPYFKEEDSIYWIKTLRATQSDGSPTNINLKHVKHWTFESKGPIGKYLLELEEGQFD